jgi:hypothetical protein
MDIAILNLKVISVINKISVYTSQKAPCTYISMSNLLYLWENKKAICSVYHMHLINTIPQTVKISYLYSYAGMQTVSGRPSYKPYSPKWQINVQVTLHF